MGQIVMNQAAQASAPMEQTAQAATSAQTAQATQAGYTQQAAFGGHQLAQTAQQSAQRILTGVANNDRLILGDDGDVSGANYCFNSNPEAMAGNDTYLLDVARTRRSGKMVV